MLERASPTRSIVRARRIDPLRAGGQNLEQLATITFDPSSNPLCGQGQGHEGPMTGLIDRKTISAGADLTNKKFARLGIRAHFFSAHRGFCQSRSPGERARSLVGLGNTRSG